MGMFYSTDESKDECGSIRQVRKVLMVSVINTLCMLLLVVIGLVYMMKGEGQISPRRSSFNNSIFNSDCNIQVITIEGHLVTSDTSLDADEQGTNSKEVMVKIMDAEKDAQIKGILIEVDSSGGSSVAGSEIAEALRSATKPTIAVIKSIGASAAYWASVGAGRIIANENSEVGSIGVTYSFLDETEKNRKEGVVFQQISVGKFKDSGNPAKALSEEEKRIYMKEAEKIYENFIAAVASFRNLKSDDVRDMADGTTFLGREAMQNGLIDQVGGMREAKNYLEQTIGTEPIFCWQT